MRPSPHDPDLRIPAPDVTMEFSSGSVLHKTSSGAESRVFMPEAIEQLVLLTQANLNDLTPDPNLSKESAQLLHSDVPPAMRPSPHDPDLRIPAPDVTMEFSSGSAFYKTSSGAESRAFMPEEIEQLVLLTQANLNDLTPDPNLSKESAQLLVSRR
ncbi:hypothetical protein PoB_000719100 [Plakobranchus ocellatus]|uniref:Uncharacterized protein n=1 Tax=Plakobranchus ocellatus TaxID=259542 RepID=A0AAV3YBX3_9GAST|nr:hypothetical protein PoB_000719100 [Plakobranchus ocellatus]